MHVRDRLGLAHLAYHRAVEAARAEPTPGSWRRLVTAAKNLRGAKEDRRREAGGRPVERVAASPATHRGDAQVLPFRARPPAPRWPELARECARAHELMQRSRALVAESRRLRAELAELTRSWRRSAGRRG